MRRQLVVTGNTFSFRASLKKDGFRWNPDRKAWTKVVEDDETTQAIISACDENGLHIEVKLLSDPDEKKYFVKESWIFNLESMHDKIWCLSYDIDEGKLQLPITVAGKVIKDVDDLWDLQREAEELEDRAKSGKVTGREYGRIKEIVAWRIEVRYARCLEAGMSEAEAGKCFEDM